MRELRPVARTEGLTTEEVEGELLIFDELHEPLLRMNLPAALVWRNSDGTRTVADLVAVLSEHLGEVAGEDQVMIALDELAKHALIESGYEQRNANAARLSRRQFIRRAGVVAAAAVAVPVVHNLIVPEAAAVALKGYHYRYKPGATGGSPGGGTGGGSGAPSGGGGLPSDRNIKDAVVAVRWE